METVKSPLHLPPASSSTNFDDLIKDHHPHVLAPLQPTKYTTSNGAIVNGDPTVAANLIPALPATSGKQPPVIVGVAVKQTLRKPSAKEDSQVQQDVLPLGGTTGDVLERWHSDIFDCPSLVKKSSTASGDDFNNNTGISSAADFDGEDLIDFSTEIDMTAPVCEVQMSKPKKVKKSDVPVG